MKCKHEWTTGSNAGPDSRYCYGCQSYECDVLLAEYRDLVQVLSEQLDRITAERDTAEERGCAWGLEHHGVFFKRDMNAMARDICKSKRHGAIKNHGA